MRALVLLVVALLLPSVGAAPMVVSENGQVGLIPEGAPATFHVVHMEDGVPAFHRDTHVRVWLDGTVVYETTPRSGHEYDGIHSFTIAFAGPGDYRVEALEGGKVVGMVEGTVTPARHVEPTLQSEAEDTGDGVALSYAIQDAAEGSHTENMVRLHADGRTLLRTELHDHSHGHSMTVRLPATHAETTHVLYQAGDEATFRPVHHVQTLDVPATLPALPGLGAPSVARNDITVGEGTQMHLVATYDPFTTVTPGTLARFAFLAMDPRTGDLLPHTDMEARLLRGDLVLWESTDIHEHDGLWELATRQEVPGNYRLEVKAANGDRSAEVVAAYTVTPALPAPAAAAQQVRLTTPPTAWAGTPTWINHTITDAAGQPFAHGEMELTVRDETGAPVLVTKLHTHDDGRFALRYAFPAEGRYMLEVDPFVLDGAAATFTGDLTSTVEVLAGLDGMADRISADMDGIEASNGGMAAVTVLGALALAGLGTLLLVRRR